ncbi:uncharacterized protein LOC121884367 isoform X2 [Thunnus maccoyii]|uniref:uncharacterized protein LOC121884367 isoform X2 n=1 Tax=Thunnus maccoyii TaxID=8240 RepID=UPI001C4BB8FC|nr:uncharacterized protein LOC121884367 isoform X2 [Thunnus maccoyii]
MDKLHVFLVVLLGVVSCSHDGISGSVLEVTVRPGDNITLYCDCKTSSGVYIVWYRNCSHENQPSLVLKTKFEKMYVPRDSTDILNPFPRFHLVKNQSSESYDLLIMNITDSDEGLYYCGTEQTKVEDKTTISDRNVYTYGNATRIVVNSSEPRFLTSDCGVCWTLLFSLCPACSVLSSLLSSILVYHICKKTVKEPQVDEQTPDTRGQTRLNQGEDVCYAALENCQASQRPTKKKTPRSDFSTYSAINTSGV